METGARSSFGLERPKGHAHRAKESRIRFLRCITIDVAAPGDFKSFKTGLKYFLRELCFQQSASNSAGPQLNLSFGAFGERLRHENVSALQPATRLEHAIQLEEHLILIR